MADEQAQADPTVTPTKAFPTADVLSSITGRLVGPIGGVDKVINWMTGEDVFTHQLPRICREATPVVLKAHPELAAAVSEAEDDDAERPF